MKNEPVRGESEGESFSSSNIFVSCFLYLGFGFSRIEVFVVSKLSHFGYHFNLYNNNHYRKRKTFSKLLSSSSNKCSNYFLP